MIKGLKRVCVIWFVFIGFEKGVRRLGYRFRRKRRSRGRVVFIWV